MVPRWRIERDADVRRGRVVVEQLGMGFLFTG